MNRKIKIPDYLRDFYFDYIEEVKNTQVIIIGGGLAGLTAANHLSRMHIGVVLIEKEAYPKHKVCGEYLSNEVLPYLQSLEIDLESLNPARITKMTFSSKNGDELYYELGMGGMGISRYALDDYLLKTAKGIGCEIIKDTALKVRFVKDKFVVETLNGTEIKGDFVLGAYGKRSNLDKELNRDFIKEHSGWLAIKAHYLNAKYPKDLVSLHNFKGGYCGLSATENGSINVCYLANYKSFKAHRSPQEFKEKVLMDNPALKEFFLNSKMTFEKELSIAQVSFEKKELVKDHIMMLGDAAGLIHPLCGNGMAMAIHSAKLASEHILQFYKESEFKREDVEREYSKIWKNHFKNRLKTGRMLQKILLNDSLSDLTQQILQTFPSLMPHIIKRTHGKPIYV